MNNHNVTISSTLLSYILSSACAFTPMKLNNILKHKVRKGFIGKECLFWFEFQVDFDSEIWQAALKISISKRHDGYYADEKGLKLHHILKRSYHERYLYPRSNQENYYAR